MSSDMKDTVDQIFFDALRGKTVTAEQASILEWAQRQLKPAVRQLIKRETDKAKEITGETSDGYHTFNELYEYRLAYNAALFNEWALQGKYEVHKSKKHSDGDPCFDGTYFIVVAQLPTGQISNHYKLKYWDEFNLPERAKAAEYDGHTPKEALDRLAQLKQQQGEGK